jgi:phenylacetic acid degradation operon negative regulatory protein
MLDRLNNEVEIDEPERKLELISLEKQIMYMLLHKKVLEASEIIEIYRERKKSSQVIRNSLSHLKKQGYVENSGHTYFLTPLGDQFVHALQTKFKHLNWTAWNEQWSFVCYGLPEQKRIRRMALRRDLIQLGYGQLYQNILVSAHNEQDLVLQIIDKYQIKEFVSILYGKFTFGEIDGEKVGRIWNLASIQERYMQFIGWVRLRKASLPYREELAPWYAFLAILELGEFYGEIILHDPFLPKHLLPPNWPADLAFEMYTSYYTALLEYLNKETHLLGFLVHN